ncbi:MAG: type III polyketide synthase [Chitinophagaceae bacterium]
MSKIISIGTALPPYCHRQTEIFQFMAAAFQIPAEDFRKVKSLYDRSGIETRYSVVRDYSRPSQEWEFYHPDMDPFPLLEKRMEWFETCATPLSIRAIEQCIEGKITKAEITHLITVTCTGLSAPGLDIRILQQMGLPENIPRTSVNFMGCYAALHALKMADAIARTSPRARVVIVCTELCTLHFQKDYSMDYIASSLLFADGSAAALVSSEDCLLPGLHLKNFYSEVHLEGQSDMAWKVSGKGFLMTLSGYIPALVASGIGPLLKKTLQQMQLQQEDITHWAIHPGGKKILDTVQQEIGLAPDALKYSREILRQFGNMSSPTILFVLRDLLNQLRLDEKNRIFVAAFGPGLTLETLILES